MSRSSPLRALAALAAAACATLSAQAAGPSASSTADGRLVDQSKVLNGGVSAGDAPGFPLTLSEPGLYRLTGNLTVSDPNLDAVQITADGVTLDLNGYSIVGPVSCTGSGAQLNCAPTPASGVGVRASQRQVTVRRGTIRGFGAGVLAGALSRVEDMSISHMNGTGIAAGATSAVARNVVNQTMVGIQSWGLVRDNVVSGARNVGIGLIAPGIASGNLVTGGGGTGLQLPSGTAAAFNVLTLNDGLAVSGQGLSLGDANTNLCGAATKC
jgi:hypothetical protein